jgi:hypothetical protein
MILCRVRDGAFILIDKQQPIRAFANDRDCEARLWDATAELPQQACPASAENPMR